MAKSADASAVDKKKLQDEKKKLKADRKSQKREVKKRAKEIAAREADLAEDEEGGGFFTFLATLAIIVVWIGIVCVIIKLDVGGFGSNVLTPLLKDVPVVNKILPSSKPEEEEPEEVVDNGGYTSLSEAVDQIRKLELQLQQAQTESLSKDEDLANLRAEVARLQEFEAKQVEFQHLKTEFFNLVVYSEKGPGVDKFIEWYGQMDPATAEYLYKQAVAEQEADKKVQEYAQTYSSMKPARAAAIFGNMKDDLNFVANVLSLMDVEGRSAILAEMDPEIAAKITKIMYPQS